MSSSAVDFGATSTSAKAAVKILRSGFAHPQAQRALNQLGRGADIPEVGGRACTWDAITDDDPTDAPD